MWSPPSIGRYQLRGELGAGGFATVYRAYDPVLDRDTALKVLHPHLARDAGVRERFLREGRALARVRHPNMVTVYDAGEENGAVYLSMELIQGRTLAELVEADGPLPLAEVGRVLEQVAGAVEAVHAAGLIHRDIKPANVLVEEGTGRAVLLDLGVVRTMDAPGLTMSDMIIGTPGYMAPEQADESQPITAATDVYQLGALAYALVTGRPPYEGTATRVLYAVVHGPPPDARTLRPEAPEALAAALMRMLAKDPARRPAAPRLLAAEFRNALAVAAGGAPTNVPTLPSMIPPVEPITAATPAGVFARDERTIASAPAPPASRGLSPLAFGGIVGVIVALIGGVVLWAALGGRGGDAATPTPTGRAGVVIDPTTPPRPTATPTRAATATAAPTRTVTPAPTASATALPTATATPPPTATAAPTRTPTVAATAADVANTLRAVMNGRNFDPDGPVVQTRATNSGGTLSAQKGLCRQTANGRCQQVFFFVDNRFLGTDTLDPSQGITDVAAVGVGRINLTYANFAPNDPGCCPSLPPVTITYTWDGTRLQPSGTPPGHRP